MCYFARQSRFFSGKNQFHGRIFLNKSKERGGWRLFEWIGASLGHFKQKITRNLNKYCRDSSGLSGGRGQSWRVLWPFLLDHRRTQTKSTRRTQGRVRGRCRGEHRGQRQIRYCFERHKAYERRYNRVNEYHPTWFGRGAISPHHEQIPD